ATSSAPTGWPELKIALARNDERATISSHSSLVIFATCRTNALSSLTTTKTGRRAADMRGLRLPPKGSAPTAVSNRPGKLLKDSSHKKRLRGLNERGRNQRRHLRRHNGFRDDHLIRPRVLRLKTSRRVMTTGDNFRVRVERSRHACHLQRRLFVRNRDRDDGCAAHLRLLQCRREPRITHDHLHTQIGRASCRE